MYSKLVSWEVENFMSIEHAVAEFDERNIVNFKGYNDSGKSAMLQALKVLFANTNPQKQASFIQDDKDYFRVIARFDDGVTILRDKYINGQSLYEMYKDDKLLYTTKSGNALARVNEVPAPIAEYLGLVMYEGTCLNARACFEKQLGVQTTGSENYKMFNTVLKSEEIAMASSLLNNDRNRLASDISGVDSQLEVYKGMYKPGITQDMIDWLKIEDSSADGMEEAENRLGMILNTKSEIDMIPNIPALEQIDVSQFDAVEGICSLIDDLSAIKIAPSLTQIDLDQVDAVSNIVSIVEDLSEIRIAPVVEQISFDEAVELQGILNIVAQLEDIENDIESSAREEQALSAELEQLQADLAASGVKMIKCPNCGYLFSENEAHGH